MDEGRENNVQLRQAWDFVEHTGRSIFLTGKAGTGKTTFLRTVVEHSRKRNIVVAPTGVAAINAGGMTIHSFFQLPFSPFVPDAKVKSKFEFGREKRKIIASLDLLIIDEISMVRSDLLDAIDSVLRRFRDRYQPFGGVQLLMIGDLAQLTPVVTPEDEQMLRPYYDTPYFFGSKALAETEYVTIQLEKVYRQQDETFISILNHVREGKPTVEDLAMLNSRSLNAPKLHARDGNVQDTNGFASLPHKDNLSGDSQNVNTESYIRLTTHNHIANRYNETELRKLTTPSFRYEAEIEGTFPDYSYPTSETLELKVGTQVMFVKNDPKGQYYNGRIGHVVSASSDSVVVRCSDDGQEIEVEPLTWENARYTLNEETREIETEVQGTFTQYPLRLAWAITIHKSQGLTFDHAIIDADQSFAPGQVYVALSRCRTLEGMMLATPLSAHAIINDCCVDAYIAQQETDARRSIEQLPLLKQEYHRHLLLELFDFKAILYGEEYLLRLFNEFFYHSYDRLTTLHKQTLEDLRHRVMEVTAKWTKLIIQTPFDTLHSEPFLGRVQKAATYFAEQLEQILAKPIVLSAEVKVGNKQAMNRLGNALPELRQAWLSRRYLLTRIAEDGFSIATYLKEKQIAMLEAIDEKKIKQKRERKAKTAKEPKPVKEKTWETSLRLYRQGMNPDLIAKERGLTVNTIVSHLARFIPTGEIQLEELVPPEHLTAIRQAILRFSESSGLPLQSFTASSVISLCPDDITYNEVSLVMKNM